MNFTQRSVGIVTLLALLIIVGIVYSQDNNSVSVVGSGIVSPILTSLSDASGVEDIVLETEVTGTRDGFEQFCQGNADIVTSNRSISADENVNCANNSVDYTELLIAHDILAFIVAPSLGVNTCLTTSELNSVFAPSAQSTSWNQISSSNSDLSLSVVIPESTDPSFAVLDHTIEGDGIRNDATAHPSSEIVSQVLASPGTIGAVRLADVIGNNEVSILQVDSNNGFGCQVPSASTVEERTYSASDPLFLYVNRASLQKAGLTELLSFVVSGDASGEIGAIGLIPPTERAVEANITAVEGTGNTRPFSEAETSFQIPNDASGQVKIAGAANASTYLNSISQILSAQAPSITADVKLTGQDAGVRRLCNGEVDITVTNSALTSEQDQNCAANNIETLALDMGNQAIVLVANAEADYLTCLTNDQLKIVWGANSPELTSWSAIDPTFPDVPVTLLAPTNGDSGADLLLESVSDVPTIIREVENLRNDVLYRAAAVGNVEGALTFMTWGDYQKVIQNNQDRIQLVSVNAGNGCVQPSIESIASGAYSIVRSTTLHVKTSSLTSIPVQSFLWTIVSDSNYSQIENAGFIGLDFGSLPALRQTLQKAFLDASEAAALAAEQTPEATAEATAEATSEG